MSETTGDNGELHEVTERLLALRPELLEALGKLSTAMLDEMTMAEVDQITEVGRSITDLSDGIYRRYELLGKQEEDESIGIITRYAKRHLDFSLEEISELLLRNDIELPEDDDELADWFAKRQELIVALLTDKGEKVTWIEQGDGLDRTYALALVGPVEWPEPKQAVAEPQMATRVRETAPVERVDARTTQAVNQILQHLESQGDVRPKDLERYLTDEGGLSAAEAHKALEVARSTNVVYRVNKVGVVHLSLTPPPEKVSVAKKAVSRREQQPGDKLFDDLEVAAAVNILDNLASSTDNISQGPTVKQLLDELQLDMTAADFKRLAQKLETMRLVRLSGITGEGRKSPRITLRGVDTKQRWKANRDGYINRLRQALVLERRSKP